MTRQLREHVIEERNAGMNVELAGPVQIQLHLNVGLIRLARL
jgi:hypothetical protein